MRRILSQALVGAVTTLGLTFCVVTPSYAVPIISFVPDFQQVANPGDPLTDVNIVISNLGAGEEIGSFDIDVSYNSAVVSLVSFVLGSGLGTVPAEAIDLSTGDSGGLIDIAEVSLLSEAQLQALQGSSFVLATLDFDAIGFGLSPLVFVNDLNFQFADGAGLPMAMNIDNGAIRVGAGAVPEPSVLWLLALGGGALARSTFRFALR